jgi:hypothetical protein
MPKMIQERRWRPISLTHREAVGLPPESVLIGPSRQQYTPGWPESQ